MSIEAWACVAGIVLSFIVSKDIAIHYSVLLAANLTLQSGGLYDSTVIAVVFAMVALADLWLGLSTGRLVWIASAALAAFVSFEQLLNLDTLLNNLIYADACITAWIIIILAMEWREWAKSKRLLSSP